MRLVDWFFGDGDSPAWWQRAHRYVISILICLRWPVATLLLLRLLCACGSWTAGDQRSITHAATLAGMAYQHSDGGAERALIRGAFCSSTNVLERHHDSVPDAGIECAISEP
jgi:hypothetical protein